ACATVAEIVFPSHVNHRGVLHGGPAMAWMAKAGFVAATRAVRRTVVMAGSERLDFKASAYVGDVVEVTARVVGTGRRSVRVTTDMWAESPMTGERRLCTSAVLTFVAVA
ncbi:acyl-CoA thioesterase, partial [Pelomonas sp. HMWF004]